MNKVTLEITSKEYIVKVNLNGEEFIEKHIKTNHGATGIEGDFESESKIPDNLYDALNNFFAFDVMNALNELE